MFILPDNAESTSDLVYVVAWSAFADNDELTSVCVYVFAWSAFADNDDLTAVVVYVVAWSAVADNDEFTSVFVYVVDLSDFVANALLTSELLAFVPNWVAIVLYKKIRRCLCFLLVSGWCLASLVEHRLSVGLRLFSSGIGPIYYQSCPHQ